MIKEPRTKQDKKHNQQAFYTYAANKTVIDWRDAYAKTVFNRKPYYMIQNERLLNEEEGRLCASSTKRTDVANGIVCLRGCKE